MLRTVVDLPSNMLRAGLEKAWQALPESAANRIEDFSNNRSWVTRGLMRASLPAAMGGAAFFAATGPLSGLMAAGVGATIGGRATRLHNLWTGQYLPNEPKAPLLETAHKIALFEAGMPSRSLPITVEPLQNAQPTIDVSAQMRLTDQQLNLFIQSASIAATIRMVHTNCLDLEIPPEILPKIILEASMPGQRLWPVYMKYLGTKLTIWQWIRANFWFFLAHSFGIVPNSIKAFMTNVLKEGRKNFGNPAKINQFDRTLSNLFDKVSSFLDVYNSATREYAETKHPCGDVDWYRKNAIVRFTGKDLDILIKEFCTTLVDQFFPRIPFFETMKQCPLIGWIFTIFDYLLGGIANCIGRKILKWQLPAIVQNIMESGIDSTNPTNLPFSIAVISAATEFFRKLETSPNTPELAANTPRPEKLSSIIEKFLDTLELNGSQDEPLDTQRKIQNQIQTMEQSNKLYSLWRNQERMVLREAMGNSIHKSLQHISKNTEQLFSSILNLLNSPFIGSRKQNPTTYSNAMEGLDLAAHKTFHKLIYESFQGIPVEHQREFYDKLYKEYKSAVDTALKELCSAQSILQKAVSLDQLMQGIELYASALKNLTSQPVINQAHLAGVEVQNAFYEAFHPFHIELPQMADLLIHLQALIKQEVRNLTTEQQLAHMEQIATTLLKEQEPRALRAIPTILRESLDHLQKIPSQLSGAQLQILQAQIKNLEQFLVPFKEMQERRNELNKQEAPDREKTILPSWVNRIPSMSKFMKQPTVKQLLQGPTIEELHRRQESNERQYAYAQLQLQKAVLGFQGCIGPMRQAQRPMTEQNTQNLTQQLQQLAIKTNDLARTHQSIARARVETHPFLKRTLHRTIADRATPFALNFFKKVLHFITKKDPYDAMTRLLMQWIIEAYGKKK